MRKFGYPLIRSNTCPHLLHNFANLLQQTQTMRYPIFLLLILISSRDLTRLAAQTFPSFGPEIKVLISGYSGDAMEPFLSPDGNTLFFNSLNNGFDTRLHYATRVDDSLFTYVGEVIGANEPGNPQLNAVASLDTTGNFLWVSTRGYPGNFDNLHRGDYSGGTVTNVNRVHGTFYVYQAGYIVMDAAVTYDGSELYYCNAFFDTCTIPCDATLGIASRVNDSTFNTTANSAYLLQHVNDTDYCVYAPQLSTNGLELYFTRYLKGSFNTEICVSVRNTVADTFSSPMVLISEFPNAPEAATLNTANTLMYYHKKTNGTYTIYLRYRDITGIEEYSQNSVSVYPNPASTAVSVSGTEPTDEIVITNSLGQIMNREQGTSTIDVANLPEGIYFLHVYRDNTRISIAFTICR